MLHLPALVGVWMTGWVCLALIPNPQFLERAVKCPGPSKCHGLPGCLCLWGRWALRWAAGQSTSTPRLHRCPLTWVFFRQKAGGVRWTVCNPGSAASRGKCESEAGKCSQHPQCSQTHWDQSLTAFIIPPSAEPCRCRKEPLTDPGAWNMSTAGGFSLPTASAWSQSNIALTHNLRLFFIAIKKMGKKLSGTICWSSLSLNTVKWFIIRKCSVLYSLCLVIQKLIKHHASKCTVLCKQDLWERYRCLIKMKRKTD